MPYIIKLFKNDKPFYLEWSTITDAPVTNGMNLEDFRKYYIKKYGESSEAGLNERLARVEIYGTSGHPPFNKLQDLIELNRAGDADRKLNLQQIIEVYCESEN